MSKVFLPQFSPSKEPPQEFGPPSFHPGGESSSAFQVRWPHLLSRENAQRVDQAAKAMEEKILKQARDRALLLLQGHILYPAPFGFMGQHSAAGQPAYSRSSADMIGMGVGENQR